MEGSDLEDICLEVTGLRKVLPYFTLECVGLEDARSFKYADLDDTTQEEAGFVERS